MAMDNVVITGAAHGLGAALARRFARAGSSVALLDVAPDAVAARADEIAGDGGRALGIGCDVTSFPACREALSKVTEAWGGIDVLVNNAGITQVGLVRDTEPEVIRRVLDVNFLGAVHCTRLALPSLLARRGRVVAISSVAGFAPLATRAGYVASKHALEGFFDTLRTEHTRDGLRVTVVCPSFVRTDIGSRALGPDGELAGLHARTGVRNEVGPESAADTIFGGVVRGRRRVWVGREARLAWWLTRLWPAAYERMMIRRTLR
jgi:NAD(P)-dependent dehydrogenase (short-subunit alcohol dehydrogenase family)